MRIDWVASGQGISEAQSSYPVGLQCPKMQLELTSPCSITCTRLLLIYMASLEGSLRTGSSLLQATDPRGNELLRQKLLSFVT